MLDLVFTRDPIYINILCYSGVYGANRLVLLWILGAVWFSLCGPFGSLLSFNSLAYFTSV